MHETTPTENTCPVQAYISQTIDLWRARRRALLAFKRIAERYHDKPVEKMNSDPAAKAAAQAIMDLPGGVQRSAKVPIPGAQVNPRRCPAD